MFETVLIEIESLNCSKYLKLDFKCTFHNTQNNKIKPLKPKIEYFAETSAPPSV